MTNLNSPHRDLTSRHGVWDSRSPVGYDARGCSPVKFSSFPQSPQSPRSGWPRKHNHHSSHASPLQTPPSAYRSPAVPDHVNGGWPRNGWGPSGRDGRSPTSPSSMFPSFADPYRHASPARHDAPSHRHQSPASHGGYPRPAHAPRSRDRATHSLGGGHRADHRPVSSSPARVPHPLAPSSSAPPASHRTAPVPTRPRASSRDTAGYEPRPGSYRPAEPHHDPRQHRAAAPQRSSSAATGHQSYPRQQLPHPVPHSARADALDGTSQQTRQADHRNSDRYPHTAGYAHAHAAVANVNSSVDSTVSSAGPHPLPSPRSGPAAAPAGPSRPRGATAGAATVVPQPPPQQQQQSYQQQAPFAPPPPLVGPPPSSLGATLAAMHGRVPLQTAVAAGPSPAPSPLYPTTAPRASSRASPTVPHSGPPRPWTQGGGGQVEPSTSTRSARDGAGGTGVGVSGTVWGDDNDRADDAAIRAVRNGGAGDRSLDRGSSAVQPPIQPSHLQQQQQQQRQQRQQQQQQSMERLASHPSHSPLAPSTDARAAASGDGPAPQAAAAAAPPGSYECGGCDAPIPRKSRHVAACGRKYHPACFVCAHCSEPLITATSTRFEVMKGNAYHAECCVKQYPKCVVCASRLLPPGDGGSARWKEHHFWREPFCDVHTVGDDATLTQCDICQRQLPQRRLRQIEDGRRLCVGCGRDGVCTQEHALAILHGVTALPGGGQGGHDHDRGKQRRGGGYAAELSAAAMFAAGNRGSLMGISGWLHRRFGLCPSSTLPWPSVLVVEPAALSCASADAGGGGGHTRGLTLYEEWRVWEVAGGGKGDARAPGGQRRDGPPDSPSPSPHAGAHYCGSHSHSRSRSHGGSCDGERELPGACAVTAMLIASHLPPWQAASVLAHEAVHALLRLQSDEAAPACASCRRSVAAEEGLCQLVAWLWLRDHAPTPPAGPPRWGGDGGAQPDEPCPHAVASGYVDARGDVTDYGLWAFAVWQIEADASPVYGDGFRAAREALGVYTLGQIFEHVRVQGDLPPV